MCIEEGGAYAGAIGQESRQNKLENADLQNQILVLLGESLRDSGPSPSKDASGRKALPNGSEWHRSAPSAKDLCHNDRSQDERNIVKRQRGKDAEQEETTFEASKDLEDAGDHCQHT